MGILYYLIVGATAGWLSAKIMHGSDFGPVGSISVGIVRVSIGGWLFGLLGITTSGGLIGSIITAVAGAVALLWVAGMLKK